MAEASKIFSVSELTRLIRNTLEDHFGNTSVEGEISNYFLSSAGHIYFTLKDAGSQIKTVFFKGSQRRQTVRLEDGQKVRVHGDVSVYEKGGNYQITARRVEPVGKGDLHAQFEALKLKLHQEGLFDESRKRPLPFLPQRLAVVTSPRGAAIRDFLNVITRRYPNMHIVIFPVLVQGEGAAAEIASAIESANVRGGYDVIVLTRGGGSLEDLWSFNEEVLIRAIAASRVPVVAGVGHEIDVTLADLAADLRALTPTDAAVKVSPDGEQIVAAVAELGRRLTAGLNRRLAQSREQILQLARSRIFADPTWLIRDRQGLIAQQAVRLRRLAAASVARHQERLAAAAARLEAGSPLQLLARGWSLTWQDGDADRRALRSVTGLEPGTALVTQLADGRVWSSLERIERDDRST